jgi:hypothetical protein
MYQPKKERVIVVSRVSCWYPDRAYGFAAAGGLGDPLNTTGYFIHLNDAVLGTPVKGAIVRGELHVRARGSVLLNTQFYANRAEMDHADAIAATQAQALAESQAVATLMRHATEASTPSTGSTEVAS